MTAQPEVPGAAAVYLFREELTDDESHNFTTYVRLKVLTERGKEYGTVELPYEAGGHAHISIADIEGRTIHPDGKIVPFTGKPFDKLIVKNGDTRVMSKVFSLPDIEVGSILEYRYKTRYEDNFFIPPRWDIQTKLYTRRAHYGWRPTDRELTSSDERGTVSNRVAWFPMLPADATVKIATLPVAGNRHNSSLITLDVASVPPVPVDDYLPPMSSTAYRVYFYYTSYTTQDEFWREEGKHWSKVQDKFIGPGAAVRSAVQGATTPADAPQDKLRKLYHAVMMLENTDFTREHTNSEERANGMNPVRNTDDVLTRKRGTGNQLAELFVAMARAAGMKAYLVAVTNRDNRLFIKGYLSLNQLDDYLAVVNVDGKEIFFDPGQRYEPFEHMAWKHTFASGIRQTEKGVTFADLPGEPYRFMQTSRLADLKLGSDGEATGTVRFIFAGDAAVRWRQSALTGDSTSLDQELIRHFQSIFGTGIETKVVKIDKLTDFEDPLTATFSFKGPIASSAGRRLIIPSDLFVAQDTPTFPGKERKYGIFFHYPYIIQDVVRIQLPEVLAVESIPKVSQTQFQKSIAYHLRSEQTPTSYTIRRDFILGEIAFPVEQYPELRSFFGGLETEDHEPVVLKPASTNPPSK